MTLKFLKSTGQLPCGMSFSLHFTDVFLMIYDLCRSGAVFSVNSCQEAPRVSLSHNLCSFLLLGLDSVCQVSLFINKCQEKF